MNLDLPAKEQEPLNPAFREVLAGKSCSYPSDPEQDDEAERFQDDGELPAFHNYMLPVPMRKVKECHAI